MQIIAAAHHENFFLRNYYSFWNKTPMGDKFSDLYAYLFINKNPNISNDRIYAVPHIHAILKRHESELLTFDVSVWESTLCENKIKNCPFCGRPGIAFQHKGVQQKDGSVSLKDLWYVGCPDLEKQKCICPSASWFINIDEAIIYWEKRKEKKQINSPLNLNV